MQKIDETARVTANEQVADNTYLIRLEAPHIAKSIQPGQFVQLDCGDSSLTLRRPFSIFRAVVGEIEILYQVVGRGSDLLTHVAVGRELKVLGPLGKGWTPLEGAKRALLVAGGLGAAPLGALVPLLQESGCEVDIAHGAQSESKLVARDYYVARKCNYMICTDDGSCGIHGFVTTPVAELIKKYDYDVAYVCGPEPMMKNIAPMLLEKGILTYVSLERRMACGFGACLSCIVQTKNGPKKACAYGPVFNAEEIEW